MNILIDSLPTVIWIEGKSYKIDFGFKSALLTMLAFDDQDITIFEKYDLMLDNLYIDLPPDPNLAFVQAIDFLNGGQSLAGDEPDTGMRLFSFAKDAQLIYAAFRQTHHIDLSAGDFHWWQFLAMFMDLGSDTAFVNLIALRRRYKTGKATKEEKDLIASLGDAFVIPDVDTRTAEEKELDKVFYSALGRR